MKTKKRDRGLEIGRKQLGTIFAPALEMEPGGKDGNATISKHMAFSWTPPNVYWRIQKVFGVSTKIHSRESLSLVTNVLRSPKTQ